jgi:hypothetical protein
MLLRDMFGNDGETIVHQDHIIAIVDGPTGATADCLTWAGYDGGAGRPDD